VGTPSIYDVLLGGATLAEVAVPVEQADTLSCVPATIDLAGADIELASQVAREYRLRRAIEEHSQELDYLLIDCPPTLGLLTLNALVAGREILIPIQCEYYALEGLAQLLNTVELVRSQLNSALEVSAVLLTMYDSRTRLADQVADDVRQHFGDKVIRSVIPRNVRVSEAPGYGQTVITYDAGSRGAVSYLDAARELAERGAAVAAVPFAGDAPAAPDQAVAQSAQHRSQHSAGQPEDQHSAGKTKPRTSTVKARPKRTSTRAGRAWISRPKVSPRTTTGKSGRTTTSTAWASTWRNSRPALGRMTTRRTGRVRNEQDTSTRWARPRSRRAHPDRPGNR
jgi:cellulose biosynthesis protein BcsQ